MSHQQSTKKCKSRISDAARKEIIALYEANVDPDEIIAKFNLTKRKFKDLINDYKNGRTTGFTKDEECKLIDLYKEGYNTVKLLRPYFPNIVGHTIRNKIKMFIRWGLINPTGSFVNESKNHVNKIQPMISEFNELDMDGFFNEFVSDPIIPSCFAEVV